MNAFTEALYEENVIFRALLMYYLPGVDMEKLEEEEFVYER